MGQRQPALAVALGNGELLQGEPSIRLTRGGAACSGWRGRNDAPLLSNRPEQAPSLSFKQATS